GQDQVGPQSFGVEVGTQAAGEGQDLVGDGDLGEERPGGGDGRPQPVLLGGEPFGEAGRRGVEGQPAAHHLRPQVRIPGCPHLDGQTEPVEQLGAQLALFGVHGPDEDEAARVLGGEAVPLDAVDSEGGGVDEDVDEMVGQQVDLVDVEDTAVGGGQQPRPQPGAALEEGPLQVEGADDPVLGG